MKTRFGVSYWIDRYPKSRQPVFPRLCSRVEAPVAIVGGGLTGCAAACAFSLAGIGVVVLEAERIGFGSTGACPGLLRLEPPVSFVSLRDRYGLRAARALWNAFRRAGLEMASTIRRLGIRCEFVPDAAIRVGFSPEGEAQLTRERQAMRAAGVEGTWLTAGRLARETGLRGVGGIRSAGDAYIDPYRTTLGLAAAASKRQAQIYERSGVVGVTRHRHGVDVMTDGGAVRASCVIVATNDPMRLFAPIGRHFTATDTYCVLTDSLPSFVRREFGRSRSMVIDGASPAHVLRRTTADRLLAVGADQPRPGPRVRQKAVVQRTAQLMYGLTRLYPAMSGVKPEYGWSVPVSVSSDGLPVIGPHRLYPHHLFALGLGHGGVGVAWLAARALVRHYQGTATPEDALLGFTRLR